jgi:hypothetical protein
VSQEAISAIRSRAALARRLSGEIKDPAAKAALLKVRYLEKTFDRITSMINNLANIFGL